MFFSGYHKSGEREERERSTFVAGILLGFGLACIFLVVLFVGYCYTRNSPNRAPGRSVGMPKGKEDIVLPSVSKQADKY